MTKEELWNEAKIRVDAFIDNFSQDIRSTLYVKLNHEDVKDFLYGLYFDSAEPREKQIQIDAEQIIALQKQNGELTDKVNELEDKLANADYQLEGRDNEIAELKKQIEKMKCWCNCKNSQECLIELAEQGKGMKPSECCVNCKKWEIKEK